MPASQRPTFTSIDRGSHPDDSNTSMSPPKTAVSPSTVSIHIDSPKTTHTISDKACRENGTSPAVEMTGDKVILKRTSTYTDEDSEFENDKTPLIHCNSLGDKQTVQTRITSTSSTVIVKIMSTASDSELKKEETKM